VREQISRYSIDKHRMLRREYTILCCLLFTQSLSSIFVISYFVVYFEVEPEESRLNKLANQVNCGEVILHTKLLTHHETLN